MKNIHLNLEKFLDFWGFEKVFLKKAILQMNERHPKLAKTDVAGTPAQSLAQVGTAALHCPAHDPPISDTNVSTYACLGNKSLHFIIYRAISCAIVHNDQNHRAFFDGSASLPWALQDHPAVLHPDLQAIATSLWESFIRRFTQLFCICMIVVFLCTLYA